MSEEFKPIRSYEPISRRTVFYVAQALGTIGGMVVDLKKVDISAGAGVINDSMKCLWTEDGHRIEIWCSSDGGWGASKSKEIDPDKPKT